MKRIDRLNLVDRVGRELQARMSYTDIAVFLKSFGINTTKETSGINSKWVYVKELLADTPDELVLKIADELDIAHGYTVSANAVMEDSRFWTPGYLRVFVSHLSQYKVRASQLKNVLKNYAISAFVAHEDIEPTFEWQSEIEKALFSMDALVAILTPGFQESRWTDQEVGFALGRGILVVPLRKGLDPYGFIGKVQGIQADGKTVGQIGELVFQALASNSATKNRIASALVDQIVGANNINSGVRLLAHLQKIETLPQSYLEKIRDNLVSNQTLSQNNRFVLALNEMLSERDLPTFVDTVKQSAFDEDIPF